MTLCFWLSLYITRKRDGPIKVSKYDIASCLGGTGSMRDMLLLTILLHMKQVWYFGAEREGPGLQNIWGCQCLLLPHCSAGFIVLQGQEVHLPQLILMEIAATLQVGLVENSFFCLIGFLHFAILLLEALFKPLNLHTEKKIVPNISRLSNHPHQIRYRVTLCKANKGFQPVQFCFPGSLDFQLIQLDDQDCTTHLRRGNTRYFLREIKS